MAISRRRPGGELIHHSDQGSQYVALVFGRRLREAGIAQSMGSKGDFYDTAVCESFHATIEKELLRWHSFRRGRRRRRRSSTGSRAGTTASGATPGSATAHPPTTNANTTR